MNGKFGNKGISTIAAGIVAVGSVLTVLAVHIVAPDVRQLDRSARDVASFLQEARTESIQRNAPVACRVQMEGDHILLSLDWNLDGKHLQPDGKRLVLPRGVVLLPDELRQFGTVALFNPRGGFTFGSAMLGAERLTVLYLSLPDAPTHDRREISMTGAGNLQVTSGPPA
jgi:Tfp pilus assembly protein FimT